MSGADASVITEEHETVPLLHLVFGGRVSDPRGYDFEDASKLDIVGIFADFASARKAWQARAQATVDDAAMRYVVVHLHRLFEPGLA